MFKNQQSLHYFYRMKSSNSYSVKLRCNLSYDTYLESEDSLKSIGISASVNI